MVKWIITLGIPLLLLLLPNFGGMSHDVKIFFAITLWGVLSWIFELLPNSLVGLLLPALYVASGVATTGAAFKPWSTSIPWIVIGGLIFGMVLNTSGFAKRIAYWVLLKTGGSFKGLLFGIMFAGMIIAPFIPTVMGKMAIFTPIAIGICKALDIKPKSKAASAIMLGTFLGVASPCFSYLTGGGHIVMPMNLIESVTKESITWSQYAFHNFFIFLLWSIISILIVIVTLRPEKKIQAKETVVQKYNELGRVSAQEKKIASILIVTILLLSTDFIHGISAQWIFLILGGICFLPGINLMDNEKLGKLNFPILFFITGAMAIGTAGMSSGAGEYLSNLLLPYLAGSPLYTMLATWFFGVFMNFVLTPLATVASFTVPITEMAVNTGINPLPVIYSFMQGLDQYIFPYEFAVLLFVYSFGYLSFKHMVKVLIPRMILNAVFIAVIAYPFWKLIGLI
ncbi:MAG: anion permease [Clostridiales bacterium]|nr:anion permease [Clostridiales bacterium]